MTGVLETRGLTKRFGGIVVADDINLTLSAKRIVGLIGPNGAGKTSLFNLLTGVEKPDAGSITFNGKPLAGVRTHERARLGLSRTWQNLRLFPSLTLLDDLLVAPRHYPGENLFTLLFAPGTVKRADQANREKAMAILEQIRLADLAQSPATDLTFGQQKLAGVARALMNDARCLLLDEPMAGVEGQTYTTMQKVVRDVAESGRRSLRGRAQRRLHSRDLCDEGIFMFSGKMLAAPAPSRN